MGLQDGADPTLHTLPPELSELACATPQENQGVCSGAVRYGYYRPHILLKPEGWTEGKALVYRLC